ncbi:MAG TPA: GtrA family protein [Halothiobacillus sp.]|nr:MAG: hypothetical protein B7Z82_06390 [Halothiobacillus sp. 20-54-6]HQT43261.1 GtrA family protein [Halothiobacillus sp.]
MLERLIALTVRLQSLLLFAAVGIAAAAVHLAVVWGLVNQWSIPALLANPFGFFIAFWVSFFGHRHGGFRADEPHPLARVLPRFALVAVFGFLLNEVLYAALLQFTPLPYTVALFLVIAFVSVVTYLASRHWAFVQV